MKGLAVVNGADLDLRGWVTGTPQDRVRPEGLAAPRSGRVHRTRRTFQPVEAKPNEGEERDA
jgi:hypothetical protein